MASDQPGYELKKMFDDALVGHELFDFPEYGLSAEEFASKSSSAGYAVHGFSLKRYDGHLCCKTNNECH
jgi:hypothetical protein